MSDNNPHSSDMTIQQALELAIQHHQAGRLQHAEQLYRKILSRQPGHIDAMHYLGVIARQTGHNDIAMGLIRQSIALRPNYAEAHNNLGNALKDEGQLEEAIAAYRQAIIFSPNLVEAHSNLGYALRELGQLDEAIAACRRAIALRPNYAEAHCNLALIFLLQGDFKCGFKEFEWRWKYKDFPSPPRNFSQPQWDGSALEARTILLHTEQGLGDAIQFVRYLPLVAQRGGKIIIECQVELQRLFRTTSVSCQIVARGESLPTFDLHCPLLSLPMVFGTTLDNIPQTVPYLRANAPDVEKWRSRLNDPAPAFKVGLVWAGGPVHKTNRLRSIKLSNLTPLGKVPGVRFFSLQKGEASAQAKTPPTGMELIDWSAELKDFADTAGLIANLDLVITVDTAVAHLAGAMGKPVWTLLPFSPDWRWVLEREDNSWYPTMRLFRQSVRGDWDSVIKQVAEELSLMIKSL